MGDLAEECLQYSLVLGFFKDPPLFAPSAFNLNKCIAR